MRFVYEYRTSDNILHKEELSASSVDAVYSCLKKRGIRPSRVRLAPGLMNRIASLGKRGLAILGLSLLLAATGVLYFKSSTTLKRAEEADLTPIDRCQVYGDPELLQFCELNGWTNVFESVGDCYLACYAQPGRALSDPRHVASIRKRAIRDWTANAQGVVTIDRTDADEVKKMKRIVKGMRIELEQFINDGGTAEQYCEALSERQRQEGLIRSRMVEELRRADSRSVKFAQMLQNSNADLRTIGVRPIILSEVTQAERRDFPH